MCFSDVPIVCLLWSLMYASIPRKRTRAGQAVQDRTQLRCIPFSLDSFNSRVNQWPASMLNVQGVFTLAQCVCSISADCQSELITNPAVHLLYMRQKVRQSYRHNQRSGWGSPIHPFNILNIQLTYITSCSTHLNSSLITMYVLLEHVTVSLYTTSCVDGRVICTMHLMYTICGVCWSKQ